MYQDEGYDPSDERHVEIAAKFQQRKRDVELADIRAILSVPAGRRFFWKWLSESGVFRSSFTGNNTTFFNEGKREIGLKLLADMNSSMPEAFVLMQKEENDRLLAEKNNLFRELKDDNRS